MASHGSWRRHASPRSYSLELTERLTLAIEVPPAVLRDVVTSEAAFVVSADRCVVAWNAALEQLTGVSASAVLGRSCRVALASISPSDSSCACEAFCPLASENTSRQPAGRVPFVVRTPAGPRRVELVTIGGVGNELLHLVEDAPATGDRRAPAGSSLTPRQLEGLRLLGDE